MIQRTLAIAALCLFAAGSTGCINVATPAAGMFYADVAWDGDAEGAVGSKEGRACAKSYFGFFSQGDASIAAAAKAGGVRNVTRVDHYTKNIVGIGEYCTIVGGN